MAHGSFIRILRSQTPNQMGPAPTRDRAESFLSYTLQLPLWQWELLTGAFPTADFDTLGQNLISGTRLLLCTDGRAKGNKGSYGWVIGTNKQRVEERDRGWRIALLSGGFTCT
jgi:hypothetical protein